MEVAEVLLKDEFESNVPKGVGLTSTETQTKRKPPTKKPKRRYFNLLNQKESPDHENDVFESTSGESNIKITQAMTVEEAEFRRKMLAEEKKAEQKRNLEITRQAAFVKLQKLLQCSKSYSNFLLQEINRLQTKSDCQEKPKQDAKDKENLGTKKRANDHDFPTASKRQKFCELLEKPTCSYENTENVDLQDNPDEPNAARKRKSPVLLSGGEMRPYQLDGFDWLNLMHENGVSCILADEMGLGKTIQSIAFISNLIEKGIRGPFLVCAPLSTLPNWMLEFERFAPKVPVLLFHGDKDTRQNVLRRKIMVLHKFGKYSSYPVVVTSYQIPLMEPGTFRAVHWKTMIIDEGHRIKNIHSCLRNKLTQLRVDHKILLTGTPLHNNLTELWSLLNFILPDIFSDLAIFESWFDVKAMSEKGGEEEIINQEEEKHVLVLMHEILSPFLLRRTKADVEMLLPGKKELLVYAPMTSTQERLYRTTADRTISLLVEKQKEAEAAPQSVERSASGRIIRQCNSQNVEEEKPRITHKFYLTMKNVIMMFRKICNHPYLVEHPMDPTTGYYEIGEEFVEDCGKLQVLDCLLKGLKSRGHKILLFSQMVRMLDIIKDYCDLREWTYCRLHGTMNLCNRGVEIKKFNEDPEVFLFLISTRAGGLGLNLTAADTVIIYDSDWNPQCDLQAQDRCHRIGQTKPVVVYRLVTHNSIEERMVTRAAAKRKLEKMIMKSGRFSGAKQGPKMESLSMEELREILSSTDHREKVKSQEGDVFTPEEISMLMDRSDLLTENKQATNAEVKGLYKVISRNI